MSAYTHYSEADALIKAGRPAEALPLLDRAVNLHPADADALGDRAVCLFRLSRKMEALTDLDRAMELEPDNPYRHSARGFIRAAMKDFDRARADYLRALELDPEDAVTLNNLGLLEEQAGYATEARERFRVADELAEMMAQSGIVPASAVKPDTPVLQQSISEPAQTGASLVGRVFTSRSSCREFVAFCLNGFSLKK